MASGRLVVPESTIPGTVAWAETVTHMARRFAESVEDDARPLVDRYRQLTKHEAWKLLLTDEPKTKERFCAELLGYSADFLEVLDDGVQILDRRSYRSKISQEEAMVAARRDDAKVRSRPSTQRGGDRRSEDFKGSAASADTTFEKVPSASRQGIIRRLHKRANEGQPELYERVMNGELTPYAAAVEAGWRKRTQRRQTPEDALRTLLKRFSLEELRLALSVLEETTSRSESSIAEP